MNRKHERPIGLLSHVTGRGGVDGFSLKFNTGLLFVLLACSPERKCRSSDAVVRRGSRERWQARALPPPHPLPPPLLLHASNGMYMIPTL